MNPGTCTDKSRKLFTSSFEDPPSTEKEGTTCLTSTTPGERRDQGGHERLPCHTSRLIPLLAVLFLKAKLTVGEILEAIKFAFMFTVRDK